MGTRTGLLSYEFANAALGWGGVGVLAVVAVERGLAGDGLWTVMALTIVAVALLPAAATRRPTEMPAWEVLALATLPAVARSAGVLVPQGTYVAVAALALLVAVELDAFTAVEMTPDFAVAFVVVVTMAAAGLWTVVQYAADVYLGTAFLGDRTAVMWNLVVATGIGLVAGVVFERYVRRVSPCHSLARDRRGEPR